MNILKKYLAVFAAVIILGGCNNTINKRIESESYSEQLISEGVNYLYCDEQYKDKKQLTMVLDSMKIRFFPEIDSEIINRFNKKLDSEGYDFAVNFEILNTEIISTIDYYELCIKQNKAIDIISSGLEISQEIIDSDPEGFKCKAHEKTFWEYVDKGYLLPLNDFFKTSEGEKLYNVFPQIYWDRVTDNDNKIYGVYNTINAPLCIEFNKNVAEKYNYDYKKYTGDFKSLENILETMKNKDDVAGLHLNPLYADLMYEYFGYSCLDCGIYINEKTGIAENLFDNKKFLEYIQTISDFKKRGYILDIDKNPDDYEKILCETTFFDSMQDYNQVIIAAAYLKNRNSCLGLGITSSSEYPDEAFKLLYLLYTNSEYSKLLQCGIEGRNYNIINKNEIELKNEYSTFWDIGSFPGNPYITDMGEDAVVPMKKKQMLLTKAFKSIKKSRTYGFEYPETDKTKAIKEIYKKYDGLYYGAFNNVEKTLEQANNELKSAGLDEVLNDINRQLEKYYEKNNR